MGTILVVEDEAGIANVLKMVFEDECYHVRIARDGREALTLLGQERPDLVLSDIMMPVLDGHALYAAMQADPAYRAIPFVFMSAAPLHTLRPGEQPTAFIRKPFDVDHLLDIVSAILERSASRPVCGGSINRDSAVSRGHGPD